MRFENCAPPGRSTTRIKIGGHGFDLRSQFRWVGVTFGPEERHATLAWLALELPEVSGLVMEFRGVSRFESSISGEDMPGPLESWELREEPEHGHEANGENDGRSLMFFFETGTLRLAADSVHAAILTGEPDPEFEDDETDSRLIQLDAPKPTKPH